VFFLSFSYVFSRFFFIILALSSLHARCRQKKEQEKKKKMFFFVLFCFGFASFGRAHSRDRIGLRNIDVCFLFVFTARKFSDAPLE